MTYNANKSIIYQEVDNMKEQKYIIKNTESFEPTHIFECGQCFRWNKEEDGSYTGYIKNAVINVKKKENKINFKWIKENNIT